MTLNPILDEIHAAREKLLADQNGDLHAYVEAARKRALESGRTIAHPRRQPEEGTQNDGRPPPDESPAPSAH